MKTEKEYPEISVKEISYDTSIIQSEKFVGGGSVVIIPQCCRENWDSCKHRAKRNRENKKNVGL